MALIAIQNKHNYVEIVIFTDGVHLGQENISKPLDGDFVACLPIRRSDISPGANLLELPKKTLGLKFFSFEK